MNEKKPCQSCGMPIETGTYCRHCTNERGELQSFGETLERMTQFLMRTRGITDRAQAQRQTLDYMTRMPAWREHPDLLARRGG